MGKIRSTKLREELAETLNLVAYTGERMVIDRNGKEVAAIISMKDFELLQELETQKRKQRLDQIRDKLNNRYEKTFKRLAE